jgi:hypothetical protein
MQTAVRTSGYGVPEHQRRVDEMMAAVRAGTAAPRPSIFKPAPAKPAASSNPLDLRISEELEMLRRRLDQLGGVLASEPILLHKHGTTLQSLDLMNQILGHLAKIVGSEDKTGAVEQVTLTDLAGRLKRRPLVSITGA